MTRRVFMVCVNYLSDSRVMQYIDHVHSLPQGDAVVPILVMNSPATRELRNWASRKDARLVGDGSNLGYLNGLSTGLLAVEPDMTDDDWVIIGNFDLTLDQHFLSVLVDEHPEYILAPDIRQAGTNRALNPFLRARPGLVWLIARIAISLALLVLPRGLPGRSRGGEPRPGERIWAPHGALLAAPRSLLSSLPWSSPVLIFGEELFLGVVAEQLCIPVLYRPDLKATHAAGAATGQTPSAWRVRQRLRSIVWSLRLLHGA